ncbi:unnamed protein product [Strongylus vulgaris]|uniref:BRCT domain-containing protein n=1 Tax=Strongylus vulgaris TaxID=40348 RepID=A0A3P7HZY8_STRVU|nr:unnamed protein product [Strongylus vulgaris]
MSDRAGVGGSDSGGRQKRKRVGFAGTPKLSKGPCNKAARADHFNVFLVGFSDKEKSELLRSCIEEIDVKDVISTSVTHLVVKPPSKKDKTYLYSALYYAVVSGAWLLRPSWLTRSKEGIVPELEHEYKHNQVDIHTPTLSKFKEILKLKAYQTCSDLPGVTW